MTATILSLPYSAWPLDNMNPYNKPTEYQSHYDPFAGRMPQRKSPVVFDHPQNRLSFDGRTYDRKAVVTHDDIGAATYSYPQQSGFQPTEPFTHASREPTFATSMEETSIQSRRLSQESYGLYSDSPKSRSYMEYEVEPTSRRPGEQHRNDIRYHTRRRPYNQDEFDGPTQLLPLPIPKQEHSRSQDFPHQPINLTIEEQDEAVRQANDILAQSAFHFVAKYQFPIPLERDKPRIRTSADREWTEWAYLIKRLATKRRIPARVLYENQIKQLVTTLENSITVRQTPNTKNDQTHLGRAPRDDRYILQLISAGLQVAKILMDSLAMEQLDTLYSRTESLILERRSRRRSANLTY